MAVVVGDALDCLKELPDSSVDCCVTSPPYWGLRDYGVSGQIGLEKSADDFVTRLVDVFREVRRVLRDDGTLWVNIGDSYISRGGAGWQGKHGTARGNRTHTQRRLLGDTRSHGMKAKDLAGIPWLLAFALRADGWYLRQDIIWHKPNPMPESVRDRCTKAHEYVFLLSKNSTYYFDHEAIKEKCMPGVKPAGNKKAMNPGRSTVEGWSLDPAKSVPEFRNRRSVWKVTSQPFNGAHFATFPPNLIEPCILAGCPAGGTVLDPFFGAGTTGLVAIKHGRNFIGIELNPDYAAMAIKRLEKTQMVMPLKAFI